VVGYSHTALFLLTRIFRRLTVFFSLSQASLDVPYSVVISAG